MTTVDSRNRFVNRHNQLKSEYKCGMIIARQLGKLPQGGEYMHAIAYEGYFKKGRFYVSGKAVRIPEQRRVIITIPDEIRRADSDKQTAWNDFKRMVKDTSHENDLLKDIAFCRSNSSRELVDFSDGADAQ
jgi:hypothetical protein